MNLIEDYVNTVSDITDAPRIFIEASAYHLISSTIGKYVICPFFPKQSDIPFKPNLWTIISGLPGISRKSTVIGLEHSTLKYAYKNYYRLSNPRITEDDIDKIIMKMIIETGSPEGIVDHISEFQDTLDTFIIMSSEWGAVLKKIRGHSYMEELSNLLSKLYDGSYHIWYGSKRRKDVNSTRYIRAGLYVTTMVGLQEMSLYVDRFYLEQGLLRRFLVVYAKPTDKDRWLPPLDLSRDLKYENLQNLGEQLGELMYDYSSKAPILAHFTGEVRQKINEFARGIEQLIISEPNSNWSLYAQSLWVHLGKLVILYAISHKRPAPSGGLGYIVTVDENDFKHAYNYLMRIMPNMQEAISSIGVRIKPVEMENYQDVLERINAIIVSAGPGGMTTRELLQKTGLIKEKLKVYLLNLMEQEKIEIYRYTPRRGRPSFYVVSTNYRGKYSDRIMKSDKVDVRMLDMLW